MYQMPRVFAEFERAMIQERIRVKCDTKAQGKLLDRPRLGADVEHKIKTLHRAGQGKRKVAQQSIIGVSVVQWVMDAHQL
jgi:DNA invertase Pin-like site-specific DNA recombinase